MHEYKNGTTMRKNNGDKNTKSKCEHKINNRVANVKYDMNINKHIAEKYDKDTIEGMQNDNCHDGMNRTKKHMHVLFKATYIMK